MPESLADLRSKRFAGQLSDPRVLDRLIGYTRAEVGGQGPEAKQAFIETVLNRGTSRDQPVAKVLSGSYFPGVTHSRAAAPVSEAERAAYRPIVDQVLAGSNVSNYATGNASGKVGFAGGPQTYAAGGERYGIEGPDKNWWQRVGTEGPQGGGVGYVPSAPVSLAQLQSQAVPAPQPAGPQFAAGPLWAMRNLG